MRKVRTRGSTRLRHEPYPLNEFPASVIQGIAKRIVHLKAVGHADMTGDQFSRIFADSISGMSYGKPLGVADVAWNGCCWSVKTVQSGRPFDVELVRLISGRNSPSYSADIDNPFEDIQATGTAVLDIYNQRIAQARDEHDDLRQVTFIRDMGSQEFTIFEKIITPLATNNYEWRLNKRNNLEGYIGERHVFTWQPHGSQFTILEPVPPGATRFKIDHSVPILEMQHVLRLARFKPEWVKMIKWENDG